MLSDFFALALNNLKRRKLRSWLTMIGIFIGIAAVVALIGLGQGLQEAITGQFGLLSTDTLTIQNSGTGFGPPGSTVIEKLNEHDVEIIKKVNGVENVVTRWVRIGTIEFNKISKFHYIGDLPEDKTQAEIVYDSLNLKLKDGKRLEFDDRGKILIGSDVAAKNNFEKEVQVGNTLEINSKKFEVVGIMEKSSNIIFNGIILMPNQDVKELLNIGDEYDLIVAKLQSSVEAEKVAEDIKKDLRRDRHEKIGEETFSVETPLEAISAVNNILTAVNAVVIGIAAISLIVGGIGIANTMYTSVIERKKEIGTMKAIGAKNSDVLWIFLIESGLLGLAGGVIGALIGLGISFAVAEIANLFFGAELIAVSLNYSLIGFSILFAFVIGVISGAIPSYQASKLKPADALRG